MLPEGLFLLAFVIAIISLSAHEATKNGDVTLGGGNVTAGRVELYNNGQWGTVCDDNWDIDDARVVCRQLGFRDAISAHGNALFGAGGGPIHISNVNCLGYESSLIECYFSLSGNCEHGDDAGVTCLPFDHGFVRLLDGNDTNGRVEIFMNGQWGTVCDDTWDILDATVVCRQLGFKGAISAPTEAAFGQGVGPIFLDTVECLGDELTILDCKYKQKSNCQHSEDAGVECFNVDFDEGSVRLAGGNHLAGRVEIYIDNQWGTVCDDDWDELDATVVCRQLGFNDVSSAPRKAAFGEGVGPIHLDSVKCSGEEASLLECEYKVRADCTHAEDASVICQEVNYARISWISVTMVTTILIGIAVIFAGIKMGVLRKISTNIVLWPIWNLCPREGPAVDDLSLPSRPSTQPEIDYRGTSDKRTGTSEPVPLDCCEKLDGSQKDEEPNIKTESTLYTTIPAELILPTQCEESYEIPRNDVKLMETAENDIEAY